MKPCRLCARTLPLSAFFADKSTRDRLRTECKECAGERRRRRRAEGGPALRLVSEVPEFVPVQSIYVPRERLIGRAVMALMLGPLDAEALADRCGLDLDDMADRCAELRPWVEAIRCGSTWLAYLRTEASAAVWEARAKVLERDTADVSEAA